MNTVTLYLHQGECTTESVAAFFKAYAEAVFQESFTCNIQCDAEAGTLTVNYVPNELWPAIEAGEYGIYEQPM